MFLNFPEVKQGDKRFEIIKTQIANMSWRFQLHEDGNTIDNEIILFNVKVGCKLVQ
jgi:hypothetical protein